MRPPGSRFASTRQRVCHAACRLYDDLLVEPRSAMPQYFSRAWNTRLRLALLAAPVYVGVAGWILAQWADAPGVTGVNVAVDQPIPFSHKFHVGQLRLDCRYCHGEVENSASAGMPSTETCHGCHQHVWTGLGAIQPVASSMATGVPLTWQRVHDLPDFAWFDHSIHVQKGIGCVTCHGRVDQMPLVWKTETLQMRWCLDCHRDPAPYVRPRKFVFDLAWQPPEGEQDLATLAQQLDLPRAPESREELGEMLVAHYRIQRYTSCSNCHP